MLAGAAGTAWAQELPATITTLIEQLAEQGGDAEELVRYYEELMQQPLNVNAASRAQLEECGLLTLFQVESLLAWRERYGALRSATELGLVEGFTPEDAQALRAFLAFGDAAPAVPSKQTYSAKFRKKWKQDGFSLTGKGLYEAPDWSAGMTIDNDPKERFPDFWSVSARYKGLYAGDFTARFGQGLVLWKSFSLSAFGTPSSTSRRGAGLREYRGTDESNFFRGLGWKHRFKAFTVTVFASYNAVDARIVDGRYTSIATDGLHATEVERAKRHAMHEWVAGANVAWQKGRWHLGVTAVGYCYDKPNGRRVQDYNRYQQYDGIWGNLGFDWYGTLGSLRLFGRRRPPGARRPRRRPLEPLLQLRDEPHTPLLCPRVHRHARRRLLQPEQRLEPDRRRVCPAVDPGRLDAAAERRLCVLSLEAIPGRGGHFRRQGAPAGRPQLPERGGRGGAVLLEQPPEGPPPADAAPRRPVDAFRPRRREFRRSLHGCFLRGSCFRRPGRLPRRPLASEPPLGYFRPHNGLAHYRLGCTPELL